MKQALEQAIVSQNIPEIETYLRQYETENPTDFDIYSYKISLSLLKEEHETAYLTAQEAVTLNPFDIEANYNLMVCARLTGHYAASYQALLMVQFLQANYSISLIDSDILKQQALELQTLAFDIPHLKDAISSIDYNHHFASQDPFKQCQDSLCGKLLQLRHNEFYYSGLADNQYDSYFHPSFIKDPVHAKCELFHVDKITDSYDVPKSLGKVLLPVCLNYDASQKEDNYILDLSRSSKIFYMETAIEKYSYLPVEDGATLQTGYPAIFGTPIPLEHKTLNGRKRLVLSIFIDSFNYYLVKEMGLENLMPETYRYFQEGVICNQYYSGSEWTLPSIATYWTGKHSGHHMNLMENYRFDFMKDSKVLAEYFHDAGYVTAKIGGNDAVTPWQGYMRGIDRFIYQSTQAFRKKEVIMDTIQHLETFKNTCQYVWLDFVDLHHIAGSFMRSIQVQSTLSLAKRAVDNDIQTSVKQTYSPNRKDIYIQELRELDFYLGILYNYLSKTYRNEEIIISLFSDHGTSFMVEDDKPFLSEQRLNVPLMIRGANITPHTCNELIESSDYTAILCKLAGIPYDFDGTDSNLPITFGGTAERDFAFSQSIFVGDPYRAALHGKNIHYYMEAEKPVSPCLRIDLSNKTSFLTDDEGNIIHDESLLEKCEAIVKNEICHLLIHPINEKRSNS